MIVSKIFTWAMFIFCCIFVIARGYNCLEKYMKSPESVHISYEFTGGVPFPVFTFCLVQINFGCPESGKPSASSMIVSNAMPRLAQPGSGS